MEFNGKTTVKIGKDEYTNDTDTKKVFKNEEEYYNFCIISITNEIVAIKHAITIETYPRNCEMLGDEMIALVDALENQVNKTKKKTQKTVNKKDDK